jgi:hypothetical protein
MKTVKALLAWAALLLLPLLCLAISVFVLYGIWLGAHPPRM